MIHHLTRIFLSVILIVIAISSSAGVDQGYAWLASQQQSDGSIRSEADLAHPLQTTVETLLAFDLDSNISGLNKASALEYVSQNVQYSTEFLARSISVALNNDVDVNPLVERLKAHQNSDGGFGSFENFSSNPLDTAMAIYALSVVKHENSSIISKAISFLLGAQSADGAFKLYLSDIPSLPLTALVSMALQNYIFDYQSVPVAIASANSYLLENTLSETNLENDWQTALTLLAVIPLIRDSSQYSGLVTNLVAGQQADGSWSQDAFTTALAVRALHLAANITFPDEPTTGAVSGQVFDIETKAPLENVLVSLAENNEASAYSDATGRFLIDDLVPAEYTVTYQYPGHASATQSASVTVSQVTNVGRVELQRLPNVGVIYGKVSHAVSGEFLTGAAIEFIDGDTQAVSSTDSEGSYSATLAPSTYDFVVSLDGFQPITGTAMVGAGTRLSFSPSLLPVDEPPPVEAVITTFGTIVDQKNSAPIANAIVQIEGGSESVPTDSNGTFTLDDLEEGEIVFSISANGYQSRQLQIVAPSNSRIDLGVIALIPQVFEEPTSSTLFGAVRDSRTGEAIVGSTILIEGTNLVAHSGTNGAYTLSGIEPLNFTVFVSAPGFWSQRFSVGLGSYDTTKYDVLLTQSDAGGFSIEQLATDSVAYNAYEQVLISANLVNNQTVPKSVRMFLEVFNSEGELVDGIPVNSVVGDSAPDEVVSLLPGESAPVETQWYTGIAKPGIYTIKVTAFDEFTSQVLSEKVVPIEILATRNVFDMTLIVNKGFSKVGLTENIKLGLIATNRSNVPLTMDVRYQWTDPDTAEFRSAINTISFTPDIANPRFVLDEVLHTFQTSGVYTVTANTVDSSIFADIESVAISVAPTVGVEASQNILPGEVVPDGDKRIRLNIQVEGVEQ